MDALRAMHRLEPKNKSMHTAEHLRVVVMGRNETDTRFALHRRENAGLVPALVGLGKGHGLGWGRAEG